MTDAVKKISMEEYMADFMPTLENFCSKSPLQPKIEYVPELGTIKLSSSYPNIEDVTFNVDPMKDKKQQIREIKKTIEIQYPIIFDVKRFSYSPEEIENLVSEGVTIKDAMNMRKECYLPRYKITRVHNRYNELDVFDFKTKKMLKFKVNIPLVAFLDKLFNSSREEISSFFRKDTRFIHKIK